MTDVWVTHCGKQENDVWVTHCGKQEKIGKFLAAVAVIIKAATEIVETVSKKK